MTNRIPPIKWFLFKTGVQIIPDQFIIFDNNYIFHQIYKYIYVMRINIFTRLFYTISSFLVIKWIEISYLLKYPLFATTRVAGCPVGLWKPGVNTHGGKNLFFILCFNFIRWISENFPPMVVFIDINLIKVSVFFYLNWVIVVGSFDWINEKSWKVFLKKNYRLVSFEMTESLEYYQ